MPYPGDVERITERAARASGSLSPNQALLLAEYLDTLRRWNEKSNLTAFELNPPSDAALDRLIIEPVVAARHVRRTDGLLIDVGSGGGSPAIPLRIMSAHTRVVLVEARGRKAAFLREVVRRLELERVQVEQDRFETLVAVNESLRRAADLMTVRAVKVDSRFWSNVQICMKPLGRLLLFGPTEQALASLPADQLRVVSQEVLLQTPDSLLAIVEPNLRS